MFRRTRGVGRARQLVKGSHGVAPAMEEEGAVLLSTSPIGAVDRLKPESVKDLILRTLFQG